MKNLNVNNIVEAKSEYTKQLRSVLADPIFNKIISTYNECCDIDSDKPVNVLIEMQKKMREIPYWNTYNIESLTRDVTKDCPYLSDLLAAVFVSNVKILTSIRMNKTKKVQLKMPSNENFVHTTIINVAEHIFNNPRVFKQDHVLLKNDIANMINDSIDSTIRTLLPIQNILQNYVGGENDSSDDSSDDDSSEDNNDAGSDEDRGVADDTENAKNEGEDGGEYYEHGDYTDESPIPPAEPPAPPPAQQTAVPVQAQITTPSSGDFFDNEHETKHVQIQDKPSFAESPFGELPEPNEE